MKINATVRLVCERCRGRRVIETSCSMCNDSTWDHECDDTSNPCPDCATAPQGAISVLGEVLAERQRQTAKWGEYDHPLVGNPHASIQAAHGPTARFIPESAALIECHRLGIPSEREAKEACDKEHKAGQGSFATIAVEEFAEAVSACVIHGETSDAARKELVQVTAVFVAMIESIDRKRGNGR